MNAYKTMSTLQNCAVGSMQCKGEGKGRDTCYSASYMSKWPEALYNLGNGSWLAWANDTAAHYAAIHYPRQRTIGPAVCS